MRHWAQYFKQDFLCAYNSPEGSIITPIFMDEFTETQSYKLACPMVDLGYMFAMPYCKYNIIRSFFLLFIQYFYLNTNVPGSI